MEITINIEKMIESGLPIREYILLYLINEVGFQKASELLDRFYDNKGTLYRNLDILEKSDYIIVNDNDVILKSKAIEAISANMALDSFELLADKIRGLFPKEKKGDKKGTVRKLQQFFKLYKNYRDEELILKATKLYLRTTDIKFIKYAHYFVLKDNISMLATYCEMVLENKEGDDPDKLKVIL
jgi:hypothetical protein